MMRGAALRTSLRIAGIYALMSVTWIMLSDRLVESIAPTAVALAWLQSVKGLAFVLLTAVVIGLLVYRQAARAEAARERLREREAYFRNLFESAPTAYQSLDADGRILDVNPAWCDLLGHEREAVMGQPLSRFVVADQRSELAERFPEFLATGAMDDPELQLRHRDGHPVTVSVDGRLQRDAAGRVVRTHCVLHDITRRKQMEDQLRDQGERLFLALEGARLGTFDWDLRTGEIVWDRRHAELFGVRLEEFDGTYAGFLRRIHPDDRSLVEARIEIARAGRSLFQAEFRVRGADGGWRWIAGTGRFMSDAGTGEPIRMGGVAQDISERKNLEAQLLQAQKMEAVGQLAGGVAHDFNNLLQVINGYAEMALEGLDAHHPAHASVGEVVGAGTRAARLVAQLLAFSRRQVIVPEDLDLDEVVGRALDLVRRSLGEHIRVQWSPQHRLGNVRADRGQMEQVLMNLCLNARDAMPGGGDLVLRTENVVFDAEYRRHHAWARPGRYVGLSVTDTGTGMPPEVLERIWEPFFTTKEPDKGTGLGLSTVYGIIRQHEGLVHVDSEPGRGTTLAVYLPQVERSAAAVAAPVQTTAHGGEETILVVEDNDSVRDLMRTVLERAGYRVLAASGGREALDLLEVHGEQVDLAILDVVMPDLGGREVHDRARDRWPDLRFLFASGYSLDGVHTDFVLAEEFALIQKPFAAADLLAAVRGQLDGVGEA